jgi:hypothetical protein
MTMKKYIYFTAVIFVFSCRPLLLIDPGQKDIARADEKFPGTTLEDLQKGKKIFESNCNKCHSLKMPFRVTEERIYKVLPVMAKRAKLDAKEEDLVLRYLITIHPEQTKKK